MGAVLKAEKSPQPETAGAGAPVAGRTPVPVTSEANGSDVVAAGATGAALKPDSQLPLAAGAAVACVGVLRKLNSAKAPPAPLDGDGVAATGAWNCWNACACCVGAGAVSNNSCCVVAPRVAVVAAGAAPFLPAGGGANPKSSPTFPIDDT